MPTPGPGMTSRASPQIAPITTAIAAVYSAITGSIPFPGRSPRNAFPHLNPLHPHLYPSMPLQISAMNRGLKSSTSSHAPQSTLTPYPTSGLVPSTYRRRLSRLSRHGQGPSHTRMLTKSQPSQALIATTSHPLTPSSSLMATVWGTTTPTLYPASHLCATS